MLDFDLWLVRRGRGWLETPERRYELVGGDCFLLPPGCVFEAGHDPELPLGVVAIHFDYLDANGGIASHGAAAPAFHRRLVKYEFVESLMTRAVLAGNNEAAAVAATWTAAALAEMAAIDQGGEAAADSGHAAAIEGVCRRVAANPAKDYQIGRLAAALGMCPDHFGRVFRGVKGVSPREFVISRRIEMAKGMLLDSSLPVGRVAELCGYDSVHYFSRHFKNRVGTTPSRFRAAKIENARHPGTNSDRA